jgi:CspA family cold shock protein
VHHTELVTEGFATLPGGAAVSYDAEQGDHGPRAVNVALA